MDDDKHVPMEKKDIFENDSDSRVRTIQFIRRPPSEV